MPARRVPDRNLAVGAPGYWRAPASRRNIYRVDLGAISAASQANTPLPTADIGHPQPRSTPSMVSAARARMSPVVMPVVDRGDGGIQARAAG